MSLFRLKSSDIFEQNNSHSPDFQKFRLTGLTNILVNISLGMRRIFMIQIYVRHKTQNKKI